MQEALRYANQIADSQNDLALTALRGTRTTRIHTLSERQHAQLQQAVQPVHQELERRLGPGWMQALREAVAKGKS